ncbi:cytochrome P450 2K6-like [Pseudophryne corroboree]|uniref:cytochrome P450 2K6-like n=1 Tax=Pseudophryne corroboree TaxID=495146 RepID=UPI0030815546
MDFSHPITILLYIITCVFVAAVLYKRKSRIHPNYPPGPWPFPIIGNIHILNFKRPHVTIQKLAKKYGSVFSIEIGCQKMVVLCGCETVRDALVNHAEEFSERPTIPSFENLTKGYGVALSNGHSWKAMKQFTISTLRDFGVGKNIIEEKINYESDWLVKMIGSFKGKPFDNTMILNTAVANIIVSILIGQRFEYDDPKLQRLMTLVMDSVRMLGSPSVFMYNAFPSLMSWFPGGFKTVQEKIDEFHSFIRETLTSRKNHLDVNDQRNLIDRFLVKQKEEKPNPELYFHDNNLTVLVTDLFATGTETTSATLRWGLLLMMKYPQIQKNVQTEIEKVIGEAEPLMLHRKQMPYTDAVIHEIQRFANIVPTNGPRMTTQDVTFKGFFLPKGTYIMPLLSSVLQDKEYFERPDEFYPQHFLDSDGNLVSNEAFLPFSAGKRGCVGENLAKMELFLFFTRLLQNFTFQAPPGAKLDLRAAVGLSVNPEKHKICAIARN